MLIIYLKELRRLQQERQAKMKYRHISSRKSMARLEDKIKLERGRKDPIDRFDIWKASSQRKRGEYINKEARHVG